MPVHAIHDVFTDPPRAVEWPFELAARRIAETWTTTRRVEATLDDLRLATPYLRQFGVTVESLPGLQVRVVLGDGTRTVTSREDVVVTALRYLATAVARRAPRLVPRAA